MFICYIGFQTLSMRNSCL